MRTNREGINPKIPLTTLNFTGILMRLMEKGIWAIENPKRIRGKIKTIANKGLLSPDVKGSWIKAKKIKKVNRKNITESIPITSEEVNKNLDLQLVPSL